MKFICNVHLPVRLSKFLAGHSSESIHVNQLPNGSSTPDTFIGQHADRNDYIVVTKDADFRNSYLLKKSPQKLIRICLGNISNDNLIQLIDSHMSLINKLNETGPFYMEINPDTVLIY